MLSGASVTDEARAAADSLMAAHANEALCPRSLSLSALQGGEGGDPRI